jgi:uncharacterized protein (DUF1501 family)
MTFCDHDTGDAIRRLSQPEIETPFTLNRRRFLQGVGAIGAGTALSVSLPAWAREAYAAAPIGANDGVLVVVLKAGGNDSLNTVVPYGDGVYHQRRGGLAIPGEQVLPLDGRIGLNPNLPYVKSLFEAGQVAVVQGVGYPNSNLSHFVALADWMRAWGGTGLPQSGWLGRYLDGIAGGGDPLHGIHLGASIPLMMIGANRRASALQTSPPVGSSTNAWETRVYDTVRQFAAAPTGLGALGDAIARTQRDLLNLATAVKPAYTSPFPRGKLVDRMSLAARLINANLGVRVISLIWGDFDSHDGQPEMHNERMVEFDAALRTFFTELSPTFAKRVTVMTWSEFGRRVEANDNQGTDHGTAGDQLLIGTQVKGGFHGEAPSLHQLDGRGNLIPKVEFGSVFATVLRSWLNADDAGILGRNYSKLDLFRAAPGAALPSPPGGATAAGQLVAVTPRRRLDTRMGMGAAKTPIGPGQQVDLMVAGTGEVPLSGVTSVVLNVTATEPTRGGFLTVWPTGEEKPWVSNLNFSAGQTVPNLVVAKVGAKGMVSIFNPEGSTQVIADVVGYIRQGGNTRLVPVLPKRLMDTRDSGGALGPNGVRDLVVVGSPVPSGAQAVVLNVTAVMPTTHGFLTVYPTGAERPWASNLNFVPRQTVPNLVVAKVGAGGKVSFFNPAGNTHVVVDLLGYVSPAGSAGNVVTVSPGRALDTRFSGGKLGTNETRSLTVGGSFGVPASGLAGLIMNVTVTEPTAWGFLTVWPGDQGQPGASNLNFGPGETVPNLVLSGCSPNGTIKIFNPTGRSHVIVDVVGYVLA